MYLIYICLSDSKKKYGKKIFSFIISYYLTIMNH